MDDGHHHAPTKQNIEQAFVRITQYSKAGDVVFVHYSGHGGRVRDYSGKSGTCIGLMYMAAFQL